MDPNPPRPEEPGVAERLPAGGSRSLMVLVAIAAAIGAGAALFINSSLDRHLHVSTDIIGYPIFHAFNPYVYEEQYYLAVILFPVVTLAVLFISLAGWRRLRPPRPARRSPVLDVPDTVPPTAAHQGGALAIATSVARVATVGAVLGLIVATARGDAGFRVIRDAVAVAIIYGALLTGGAFMLSRSARQQSPAAVWVRVARVNILAATLSLFGVLVASLATQISVSSDRTVHHFSWLPVWLAIVAVAAALLIAVRGLRRTHADAEALAKLERRAVFLVAVPVGLFLLLAGLPGVLADVSAFEVGQSMATLRLVQHGAFPWRDWVTTHGVLDDALQTLLSSTAIQDSNWGLSAGYTLLVVPASLLAMYFLVCRALGRTWPFLVIAGVMFFDPGYQIVFLRFIFWPLVLILLGVVIDRRRPWLAAVLGGFLVAQAVVSQETAYCIPAVGVAVLGNDAFRVDWHRRGTRLRGFAMTFWTAFGGALVAMVLLIILVSQHAVGDFVRFYTAFAPGHILTGAIPRLPLTHSGYYGKEALIPIVAMLGTVALLATKLCLRRRLNTLDWMLTAAAILEFFYYPKFLDRADLHVGDVFAVGVPLLILLVAAGLKAVEPEVLRRWRSPSSVAAFRFTLASVLMVGVVLLAPVSLSDAVTTAPGHYRMVAASEPYNSAIGYASPQAINQPLLADLDRFLHAYLKSGDHIFDFTNEPGLLFYILDFRPANPYYEISVAIRQVIQQDVVDRLRADRPLFVVFAQDFSLQGGPIGLPTWDDVPNMVRHYDISQYLLANYRPFADVHGQVIYVDKRASLRDPSALNLSLSEPVVTTDLPFRGSRCDWGYSPNYLSVTPAEPSPGRAALSVTVTRETRTSYLLTLPAGHQWADYNWFEMDAATVFTDSQLQLEDQPPPQGEQRAVTFATFSGSPRVYRFPIGACSQWPGYGSAPLHLTMGAGQNISSVRLLP